MNHTKKWGAAAIAALVGIGLFGAALPATAGIGDDADDNITITGDRVAGRKFSTVRIATYKNVETNESGKVMGFTLETFANAAFKMALAAKIDAIDMSIDLAEDATEIDHLDPLQWVALNWGAMPHASNADAVDVWGNASANNENLRKLANWLETQTSQFENPWGLADRRDGTGVAAADGEPASAEIDTEQGLHFVWDSTGANPGPAVAPGTNPLAMIVGTKFVDDNKEALGFDGNATLGQIIVKGDLVSIDKDIVMDDEWDSGAAKWSDGNEIEDSGTAQQGDNVSFVIRTRVPYYPDPSYGDVKFDIEDTYTSGLLPNTGTLKLLWYDDSSDDEDEWDWVEATKWEETETPTGWWTVTPAPAATQGEAETFTVSLNADGIANLGGKQIQVRYSASITSETNAFQNLWLTQTRDTNSARVRFTNVWNTGDTDEGTPGGGGESATDPDLNYVYTFPFTIIKQDINAPHNPIVGIEFSLTRQYPSNGQAPNLVETTTGIDGTAGFTGLNANEWYLVNETDMGGTRYSTANKSRTPFAFRIVANTGTEPAPPLVRYEFAAGTTDPANFSDWDNLRAYSDGVVTDDLAAFLLLENGSDDSTVNEIVTVYNAKSASDMPATGGQILLIAGIAGVLGLGALTFGAVGLRKRKALAAAAA